MALKVKKHRSTLRVSTAQTHAQLKISQVSFPTEDFKSPYKGKKKIIHGSFFVSFSVVTSIDNLSIVRSLYVEYQCGIRGVFLRSTYVVMLTGKS